MSSREWITPEEVARIKQRNKMIIYITVPVATVLLTALLTVLMNR
ncbi:hypothetical protein ACNRWW_19395 [Metabacillus sp. HB246100]|nr:hypothetical protein [Bacillus weihaiensis]